MASGMSSMFAADSNLLSCHMVSGMHNDVNNDAPNRNLRRFEMRSKGDNMKALLGTFGCY